MKPAPFEYSRPETVEEACALLAAEEGARVIAGGQTLVPMLAMRLSRPTRLVDIARIPDLAYVRQDGQTVVIGATTRQCIVERDPVVAAKLPLLAKVMPFVGHPPTRARGTIGGSIANADPAAEMALIAVTLEATLVYRDGTEDSETNATEFFIGPLITALSSTACLTAIKFPVWPEARVGIGFHEVNARKSDFAFVSAAAQVALDDEGKCWRLALAVGAVADVPIRLTTVGNAFVGRKIAQTELREAIEQVLSDVEFASDLHASADYRRRVSVTLAMRAVNDAIAQAQPRAADED